MIDMVFVVLVFLVFAILCGTIGLFSMAVQGKEDKSGKVGAVVVGSVIGLVISWLLYRFAPLTLIIPFVLFLCGTIGLLTAVRKHVSTSRTVAAVVVGSIIGLVLVVSIFQLGDWLLALSS